MVAFGNLAVDLLPDISYPSISVRTELTGAAPIEIESLVTKPIEDAVGVVNNVVKVQSSSRADTSEVTLEFAWGTNMDFAALDVRERLDVVRLPLDAEKPVLLRYDPSLDPIVRIGLYGDPDLVRMRLVAEEEVKRTLERIDGVAAVLVSGGLEEEIQVEIDERRLASLGLSVQQVIFRLASENINLTGGRLREGQTEYLVRTINEFVRAEDMESIVIDRSQGAIVRLTDVARVYKGHKEREIVTRIGGQETVEIAIYKEGGTNTVAVAGDVIEGLDVVRAKLAEARSPPAARAHHRSGGVHPAVGAGGARHRDDRRIARHPDPLSLPAQREDHVDHRHLDPGVGGRHLLPDVQLGHLAQHHVAGRPLARGGHAGRQLDRRAGGDPAQAPAGHGRDRGGASGSQRGGHGGDRLHHDHGLRLRAHRVRRGDRGPALRRSGAGGDVLADRLARGGADRDPDAGVAARRSERERGGA